MAWRGCVEHGTTVSRVSRLVVVGLLLLGVAPSSAESQATTDTPARRARLVVGHSGALGFGLEADFIARRGFSVLGSLQRWSFALVCGSEAPLSTPPLPPGDPDPATSPRPFCSPDGWGLSLGVRASPATERRAAPFIQAEAGLYRFDGHGIVTPHASLAYGLTLNASGGASLQVGVKLQALAPYEWRGVHRQPDVMSAFQVGVGLPFD